LAPATAAICARSILAAASDPNTLASRVNVYLEGLRALGLMPVPELNQLVSTSSKRGFKAGIPKFLELTAERGLAIGGESGHGDARSIPC